MSRTKIMAFFLYGCTSFISVHSEFVKKVSKFLFLSSVWADFSLFKHNEFFLALIKFQQSCVKFQRDKSWKSYIYIRSNSRMNLNCLWISQVLFQLHAWYGKTIFKSMFSSTYGWWLITAFLSVYYQKYKLEIQISSLYVMKYTTFRFLMTYHSS